MNSPNNQLIESKQVGVLRRLLAELNDHHAELHALLQERLGAIKSAQTDRIGELGAKQAQLIKQIREAQDRLKRWLTTVGPTVGVAPQLARSLPLSQIQQHVSVEERAALLELGATLREKMNQVSKASHTIGAISQSILGHLMSIFAALAPKESPSSNFGSHGSGTLLLETVG